MSIEKLRFRLVVGIALVGMFLADTHHIDRSSPAAHSTKAVRL